MALGTNDDDGGPATVGKGTEGNKPPTKGVGARVALGLMVVGVAVNREGLAVGAGAGGVVGAVGAKVKVGDGVGGGPPTTKVGDS